MSSRFAEKGHWYLTDQESEYILRLLKEIDSNTIDKYMQKIQKNSLIIMNGMNLANIVMRYEVCESIENI